MDAERKAVLVDVGLGLLLLATGAFYADQGSLRYWWLAVVVAVSTGGSAWADDHGAIGGWTTILVVAVFGVGLIGLGLLAGPDLVENVLPTMLLGLGAGLVPYRLYFGLVRPVPEGRLRGARERTV